MQNRVHKFKFSSGKGANDMLLRKLMVNFIEHGSMVTTESKGKALSSYMDRIVQKSKNRSEANMNYLLRKINSEKVIATLFDKIGPVFKDVNGGYLSLQHLQKRVSDGSKMVKLTWGRPVVQDEPVVTSTAVKTQKTDKAEAQTVLDVAPEKAAKKTAAKKATKTVTKTK